jgi:hypothetical protein
MGAHDIYRFKENQLKSKLSYDINQKKLFQDIDKIPELYGAAVIYIDSNYTITELRPFDPSCSLNPIKVVLREPPNLMSQKEFAGHLKGSQGNIRESKLVGEVAGTVLSCGAAFLGWVVVFGSGAAIPLTGGTSTAVTYLAVAASTASSLQCFNSGYRVKNEISNPDKNDYLDSQEWYQDATLALDIISVAGAAAAGAMTLKAIKLLNISSGKSFLSILKSLPRAERKRLTQEIIRINHPGISNKLLKALVKAGSYPKCYSGMKITQSLTLQLKDAIGASMSFSGSALSGGVNSLAVGIYEELAQ